MARTHTDSYRGTVTILTAIGIAIGITVAILLNDVILGVIAGSSFIAVITGLVRLWLGGGVRHP